MAAVARPATPADLDRVLDLQQAWNLHVYGDQRTTREMLTAHWPDAGHWIVDGGGGTVAAYGSVDSGGGFELWVGPGAADAGAAVLSAIAANHAGRLETVAPSWARDQCELLARSGFRHLRDVLEMTVDLQPPTPAPSWPSRIGLRPFSAEHDAAAVHACLVEAFAGSDERVMPYEEWRPWLLGDPSYEPGLVLVAREGGAVAGMAQCWTDGFVKDLAVHPAYRGRGLGEAVMRAVFAEFARRGVARVRLKVDADNPTGAVRLYRRVGMDELRRYALFVRG